MSLLATVNGRGTLAARPAAAAANEGYIYSASDAALYRSNGSSWDTIAGTGIADQGTFTYLDGTVAAAPATPAAGKLRVYAKTGKVLAVKDDAGLETVLGAGGGIASGTANPGTPADGDLFYRTDLGLLIRYHSTGTRWMCICPHQVDIGMQDALTPISVSGSLRASGPYPITNSILIIGSALSIYVNATNDASNYWSFAFTNATLTTAAVAAAAWRRLTSATTLVVDLSTAGTAVFDCAFTKTGAPGSAYPAANMLYKFIVT